MFLNSKMIDSGAFADWDGLCRPGTVSWRVNSSAALLLGGGRALLMQLAQPAVAQGVVEHSDFRSRPLPRLLRTLSLTLALSFGTRAEALAAARVINRTHQAVRGPGYSALDPALLLWVQATLLDSALVTYAAFVEPLAPAEVAAYLRESRVIGELLGIPPAAFPAGPAAFRAYVRRVIRSELVVDERARALARSVLRPPWPPFPPGLGFPFEAVTAGLLPAELREAYRLPWGLPQRAAFAALRTGFRRALPRLPGRLRLVPQARMAEKRIRS